MEDEVSEGPGGAGALPQGQWTFSELLEWNGAQFLQAEHEQVPNEFLRR